MSNNSPNASLHNSTCRVFYIDKREICMCYISLIAILLNIPLLKISFALPIVNVHYVLSPNWNIWATVLPELQYMKCYSLPLKPVWWIFFVLSLTLLVFVSLIHLIRKCILYYNWRCQKYLYYIWDSYFLNLCF